jgi:hypothetical protein
MKKFGPALCGIARDQTLRANISANSKQNSKIFEGVNLGPRGNRFTKKTEGRISRDTVPLNTSCLKCSSAVFAYYTYLSLPPVRYNIPTCVTFFC